MKYDHYIVRTPPDKIFNKLHPNLKTVNNRDPLVNIHKKTFIFIKQFILE